MADLSGAGPQAKPPSSDQEMQRMLEAYLAANGKTPRTVAQMSRVRRWPHGTLGRHSRLALIRSGFVFVRLLNGKALSRGETE